MTREEQERARQERVLNTLTDAFEKGKIARPETSELDADEERFLNQKGVDAKLERELELKASASFETQMKKMMRSMSED